MYSESNSNIVFIGTVDKLLENSVESYSTMMFCARCKDIHFGPVSEDIQKVNQYLQSAQLDPETLPMVDLTSQYLEPSASAPSIHHQSPNNTKHLEAENLHLKQIIEVTVKLFKKINQV
jgi:hypothetical protein